MLPVLKEYHIVYMPEVAMAISKSQMLHIFSALLDCSQAAAQHHLPNDAAAGQQRLGHHLEVAAADEEIKGAPLGALNVAHAVVDQVQLPMAAPIHRHLKALGT